MHWREYICVIRCCCHYKFAHTECIFYGFCHIVTTQIGDRNLRSTLFAKDFGQLLCYLLGTTMDRSVGNENAFCFYFVLAPSVIQTNVISQVFLQDRAMKRTNASNVESGCFLQKCLNLSAILTTNIEVIATSLASPVFFVRQCTELAESVGGKEYLVGLVVCNHYFWPVYHWSHEELQGMSTQIQNLSFLYGNGLVFEAGVFKELRHHLDSLGRCYNLNCWILGQKIGDISGMVRFHVLHHEIVRRTSFECLFQVGEPFFSLAEVYGVHDSNFLIHNKIRIIGDAIRDDVLAFKEIDSSIVYTNIFNCFCYV